MVLEFHPLANIFPMMTDAEVNDLGDDMLEHGQREPIWLYEGMILDGRNRYNACLLKGIEPRLVGFRGADALGFVISLNLKRRHLDESQRAMVGATLATLGRGGDHTKPSIDGLSADKAAGMLNVGKASIERAKSVQRDGTPDLIAAVEQGDVAVSAAADFAKQPREDQASQIADFGSPAAAVKASKNSQLVQQSLSNEHYTPRKYLDAARAVLGGTIDLDPASCAEANKTVRATTFFDADDDGLTKEWVGTVWLNPPYGRQAGDFILKFFDEVCAGRVTAGIILVNAHCTDTGWFQPLWSGVQCFTDHRINFYGDDERSGSTHGSVFVYVGPDERLFAAQFAEFGAIVMTWHYSPDREAAA
jgi:hypothetical protein